MRAKAGMFFAAILCLVLCFARPAAAQSGPDVRVWQVGGVSRQALVVPPSIAGSGPVPVIFAFHGHGGSMNQAARSFGFHLLWPEALVVYPQGLPTVGFLTDPQGTKAGWQSRPGDEADRDLDFFDAMLESLRLEFRIDASRIFAAGHSNGGSFTYLLWAERGDSLAAVAPSGSIASPGLMSTMKPKPVLHVSGESDPLVRFAWQKLTIAALLRLNGCGQGQAWGESCTLYPSASGNPVVTFIHPGGHEYPKEAAAAVVRFFRELSER